MHNTMAGQIIVEKKSFDELTTRELYALLKARAEVFIVEQNCPYQDLDETDFCATHIILRNEGAVVAYSRLFRGEEAGLWHIGRVLTTRRGENWGRRVMKEAIKEAKALGADAIEIEAQNYAVGFYERLGFRVFSGAFLLDNILHKKMKLVVRKSLF